MLESTYQARLIKKLERRFPGCLILKNDTDYRQGIPDLTIFYGICWAMLEVKKDARADSEPNQEYYVDLADEMSFGAFIYPEIEEEVLDALESAFRAHRQTRVSQR